MTAPSQAARPAPARRPPSSTNSPPEPSPHAPTRPRGPAHDAGASGRLASWLGAVEVALAVAAVAGAGIAGATLLHGRTALFWPSGAWLATLIGTWVTLGAAWWAAAQAAATGGAAAERGTAASRWRGAAWPFLLLLPVAAATTIYVDDAANHILTLHAPARQSLLAYGVVALLLGQAAYWLTVWARRRDDLTRDGAARHAPAVVVAIALAAYASTSLFLQWVPVQIDLQINLGGARQLLAGELPYNNHLPTWADRVHLLPVTLLVLFGPLAMLSDDAARLIFFLGNQAMWLAALAVLVYRLVPAGRRWYWLAGLLVFSAVYWPWQEAIRYGQQDGLLVFLYVLSITAVPAGKAGQAGVALALAFLVKPLSFWLPLVYVIHGRWRELVIAGCTTLTVIAVSLPFTGVEPWWHLVRVEIPEKLSGTVRGTSIPLPAAHARLFVGRERLGDGDPAPSFVTIAGMNAAASVLGLVLLARLALRRGGDGRRRWLLDAGIGLTLSVLLAPLAWQHYATWLTVAFATLCLPAVWQPLTSRQRLATGGLAGAAFFLVGLHDSRLLTLMTPIVEVWPGAFALYTAGLLSLLAALVLARTASRDTT